MEILIIVDGGVSEDVFAWAHELLAVLMAEGFDMVTNVGSFLWQL